MRYLAIDYGKTRVGLAISDPTGMISRPLRTIAMKGRISLVQEIRQIVTDEEIDGIVVGIPERGDGSPGTLMPEIQLFINMLEEAGLQVFTISESFSSVNARIMLRQNKKNPRRNKGLVDGYAAALFLQEFLDGRQ